MNRPRLDHAEIIRLHHYGLTVRQIAEQVGCTMRTVQRVKSANGLAQQVPATVGVPVSAERLAFAAQLFDDGASQWEVRRTTRLHQRTLQKHFPGRGWGPTQAAAFGNQVRRLNGLGAR